MAVDIYQIERDVNKEKKLTTPPPPIEEISSKEVYLLDANNNRLRRICGYLDKETNWPCQRDSGEGTVHVGIGRCSSHDGGAGQNEYMERLLSTIDKESELYDFLNDSSNANEDFFDVERLVRILDAFLNHYITTNQFNWSKKDIDRFLSILEQYRKLIDTQIKKEQNRVLSSTISFIIRAILGVIINNVSQDTYTKIVGQISSISFPKEVSDIEFEEVK